MVPRLLEAALERAFKCDSIGRPVTLYYESAQAEQARAVMPTMIDSSLEAPQYRQRSYRLQA